MKGPFVLLFCAGLMGFHFEPLMVFMSKGDNSSITKIFY